MSNATLGRRLTGDEYQILRKFADGKEPGVIGKELGIAYRKVADTMVMCDGDRARARELVKAEERAELVGASRPARPRPNATVPAAVPPAPAAPASEPEPDPEPDAVSEPESLEELLGRADRSSDAQTRRLSARARALLVDLRNRLRSEEQRAAAAERVRELERQLAAARTALKAVTAPPGRAVAAAPATSSGGLGAESKVIREWAARNKVPCPDRGRIPREVVDAYRAAQGEAT